MSGSSHWLATISVAAAFALCGCDADTNGLERMSSAQVLQTAVAALKAAPSVRFSGDTVSDGGPGAATSRH